MPAPKGHKFTVGNNGGQPPKYESEEELITMIGSYFDWIEGEYHEESTTIKDEEGNERIIKEIVWDREPEPETITGLAIFLGFESRQSFYDYEKQEKFSYVIKRARLYIENGYERRMIGDKNPTGSIFALKNMGWSDKQEIKHEGIPEMQMPDIKVYNNAPPLAGSESDVSQS